MSSLISFALDVPLVSSKDKDIGTSLPDPLSYRIMLSNIERLEEIYSRPTSPNPKPGMQNAE